MRKRKKVKVKVSDIEAEKKAELETGNEAAVAVDKTDSPAEEKVSREVELAQRVTELEDKLLRKAAEFDNYRKRTAAQYEFMAQSATDQMLVQLIEVMDNFERAIEHATDSASDGSLIEGTKLIYNQLAEILKRHQVEPIEAVGQPFDHKLHDALMQVDSDEFEEGVVALEMARGYKIGSRVIRHSKVGVSKGESSDDAEAGDSDSSEVNASENDS